MKELLERFRRLIKDAAGIIGFRERTKQTLNIPLYANALYLMMANVVTAVTVATSIKSTVSST